MFEIQTKYGIVNFSTKNYEEEHILFVSDHIEFIKDVLSLLAEYTKKIDTRATLNFSAIETRHILQGTITHKVHQVAIQGILPRTVSLFYGIKGAYANCHGTALMAAGIFPVLSFENRSVNAWSQEKLQSIEIEELAAGDLVVLDGNHDHSFIFLSDELCLSMNGKFQSLELYPTSFVLKIYDSSLEALLAKPDYIRAYRRKENLLDFTSMMPDLLNYWRVYMKLYTAYQTAEPGTVNPADYLDDAQVRLTLVNVNEFLISINENAHIQCDKAIAEKYYDLFYKSIENIKIMREDFFYQQHEKTKIAVPSTEVSEQKK